MIMKGSKIPRIELNTFHLYHHYSVFMPKKLQYNWHGNYWVCVWPAQLPVLTEVQAPSILEQYPWDVPHQDCGIQQNYLVSDARLRREEHAPMRRRERESSTTWETIRVRKWTDTAGPAFKTEQTPLFQGSRESWHSQFRVRERADHRLRCTPAEAALVQWTG